MLCNPPGIDVPNYTLNGIDYRGTGVSITPCLNKSDDFEEWCQYYQNPSTPSNSGYNVNSIGAKYILDGKDGDCYYKNSNGIEDPNSSRAVCDYDSIQGIPKLDVINNNLNYNVFTDCNPLSLSDNFLSSCTGLLNKALTPSSSSPYTNSDVSVVQIMAYDCNPGYGRGKCVLKSDNVSDEADDANLLKKSIY
jgi:hypothetical protein